MSSNIKVVCRFRPQNRVELENNGKVIVDFSEDLQTVHVEHTKGKNSFSFDRVFDWTSSQREVFMYGAKQVVEDVMNGYNGTIFAYGQTGSGKTFTMQGPDIDSGELRGLIPRIVDQIFTSIMAAPPTTEFTVAISYLEIYMEKIRDLLDKRNDNLQIHEEKNKGVYVKGLTSVYVSSPEETVQVMKIGTENRAVSSTNMNEESSRSHSVMLVTINQKNTKDGSSRSGKLYLVDLAGSEMVGKTGATGQTLEEAKKINKSLTALGMVINSLTDGKATHIPYRDSKLTRLLQESLGGNSRTTLVINCSPSSYNEPETLSTLRFGTRAKKIENKAKVNQELSSAELRKLLDVAGKQITSLQRLVAAMENELSIWRSGGVVPESEFVSASKIMEGDKSELEKAHAAKEKEKEKETKREPSVADKDDKDDGLAAVSRSTSLSSGMDQEEIDDISGDLPPEEGDGLMDQIVQKEVQLKVQEELVEKLQAELERYRANDQLVEKYVKENKELHQKLTEASFRLEKQSHESKEATIGYETLLQSNQSLNDELFEAKKRIEELEEMLKESENTSSSRNERIKAKMAEEMAQVHSYTDEINLRENEMRATLDKLEGNQPVHRASSVETEAMTRKYESKVSELESSLEKARQENVQLSLKHNELAVKMKTLEEEYENLLDDMIAKEEERQFEGAVAAESLHEFKDKLENQYTAKKESYIKQIEELRVELSKKEEEIEKIRNVVVDQKWTLEQLQTSNSTLKSVADELENKAKTLMASSQTADEKNKEVDALKNMMNRQLEDFNKVKEHLLKDLQNRCQKVVELEISLDQARDQYQSILRSSNTKSQQKKMVLLEKSLEQVTAVHKQLLEQNGQLKREGVMASRKLEARAERIHNLEILLQDAQERMEKQAQKYELEIQILQDKLAYSGRGDSSGLNKKNLAENKIAKPIRGGGLPTPPVITGGAQPGSFAPTAPPQPGSQPNPSLSSQKMRSDQTGTPPPTSKSSLFTIFTPKRSAS